MELNPVYVAGLERSGTSLMFALLAAHPNIAMTRRTNLWTHFYNQYGDLSQRDNFERCLSMMMRYKRLIVLEPDPDAIRREFWQGEPSYARLFALLEGQHAKRLGKPRWGDKSLDTERYADSIFAAYPGARILHMMRDPRDRYASVITRWKVRRGGIGAGTGMWLTSAKLAKRNQKRYPARYKVVRYETLATRPEETLQEICAFIGEDYSPAMLTMEGSGRYLEKGGNSSYGEREPGVISTDSIGRFRQVLSKGEIAFVQLHARRDMVVFDYQPEPVQFSFSQRLSFLFADWPSNLVRMVAWRGLNTMHNVKGRPVPSYRIVPKASSA